MKRALVTLVALSAAAIFVACGDSAVGKATGAGDWSSDMAALRAESAAQGEANARAWDKQLADRDVERKAEDDERDKKRAESDSETKKERETWRQGVMESEAKAAAEREAQFNEMMAAAAEAEAEKEKADQEAKAEAEAESDKGDAGENASDDGAAATDEDFEVALLFVRDILNARFPTFNAILNDENGAAVMKKWMVDPTSAESILGGILLAGHEGGHGYNGSMARVTLDDGRGCDKFYLIDVLVKPYTTSWGNLEAGDWLDPTPCGLTYPNSTDYVPGISRSTILLDSQNYKRPPEGCKNCILSPHDGEGEWGSDGSYSSLYLTDAPAEGKITHYKEGFPGFDPSFTVPANDSFDSGDQAFGMLFEETVQYVNSLAWAYSRHDFDGGSKGSQKTAVLLWFWWNERYLKLTRENYPEEHAHWVEHWAEPFLWVWAKGWRYLDTPSLPYQDSWDELLELVTDDLMLGEIQYVRERYHGDAYKRGSELTDSTLSTDPDGITWEGPTLSGVPLIVDSESVDGIYFATMPGGFTPVDSDRQGLADISEYIDKYNARLSVADGGYGNTEDSSESDILSN